MTAAPSMVEEQGGGHCDQSGTGKGEGGAEVRGCAGVGQTSHALWVALYVLAMPLALFIYLFFQ